MLEKSAKYHINNDPLHEFFFETLFLLVPKLFDCAKINESPDILRVNPGLILVVYLPISFLMNDKLF